MQIVIEIPEEDYERLKVYEKAPFCSLTSRVYEAIANGTPLPEQHGRLADLDAALKCVEEVTDSKEKEYAIALFDWAMSKRVIIPATKEGE